MRCCLSLRARRRRTAHRRRRPDGGRTALECAANGELVRTIDPLGRTVERIFDELGNFTAAILLDGTRWRFTHDILSRLTGITDPAGHDWIREYDKGGALTAVVDPTGVRIDASTDWKAGTATIRDAAQVAISGAVGLVAGPVAGRAGNAIVSCLGRATATQMGKVAVTSGGIGGSG